MPTSERIQWAALALLAVAVVFTVAQGVWLQDQLAQLDRSVRKLEKAAPAPRTVPAPPSSAAGASAGPAPAGAVRPPAPSEFREFKASVQKAMQAIMQEQEYDVAIHNWNWESLRDEDGLDAAQTGVVKPVFEEYEARLKALRDQAVDAGEYGEGAMRDYIGKYQALGREFYDRVKPHLKPSQWFWVKSRLAGLGVTEDEMEVLYRWDWKMMAKDCNLGDELKPLFEDSIRRLHEADEQHQRDPQLRSVLVKQEREVRGALFAQIRPKLSPEQQDRLQGYFRFLDDANRQPPIYLAEPDPGTPPPAPDGQEAPPPGPPK